MSNLSINPYGAGLFAPPAGTLSAVWQNALIAAGGAPGSVDAMNSGVVSNLINVYLINGATTTRTIANDSITFATPELTSVLAESENGYMNNQMTTNHVFNSEQTQYINDLLHGIKAVPISSIGNASIGTGPISYVGYISNILDRVAQSGLSKDEKSPIYMALMIAESAFQYWYNIVIAPAGPFTAFFDVFGGSTQFASAANYYSIPYWVEAAVEGCLLGYTNYSIMDGPKTQANSITSMIGASAAINAGKLIFKWVPNGINPVK